MTSSSVLLKCANNLLLGANPRFALLEDGLSYAALGRRSLSEWLFTSLGAKNLGSMCLLTYHAVPSCVCKMELDKVISLPFPS